MKLRATRITDNGLKCISGLENMEFLDLSETQVTDAGLRHLSKLTKLSELHLWNTRVTEQEAGEFEERMPECSVSR